MKKFNPGDEVEIMGTDGIIGWISYASPSNTDLYVVGLDPEDEKAVYPYYGKYRIYPASMLTLI